MHYFRFLCDLDVIQIASNHILNEKPKNGGIKGQTAAFLRLLEGEVWCGHPGLRYFYVTNHVDQARVSAGEFRRLLIHDGYEVHMTNLIKEGARIHVVDTGQFFDFASHAFILEPHPYSQHYARTFVDTSHRKTDIHNMTLKLHASRFGDII